jgi:hypothetical protein
MQKFLIGAVLLVLAGCGPTPLGSPPQQSLGPSPTIHFVITGDTFNRYNCVQDPATCAQEIVAQGFAANVATMMQLASEVSRLPTGPGVAPLSVNTVVVQGADFTCDNIDRAIEALPVRPGIDVVWFHHSGHGANAGIGTDPEFQKLQCNTARLRPLSEYRAKIQAKQPKLTLIFADSCNIDYTEVTPRIAAPAPLLVNYLPLLTNYRGWLMGGAASPGEFAWYTAYGGTYTQNLISVVHASDDWNRVVDSPTLRQLDTPGASNARQHPIFKSALQRM